MLEFLDFYSNVLYLFLSNDQLMKVFFFNFEQNKFIYDNEMVFLLVLLLFCDYIFKISCNVGLVREMDNMFVM